MSNRLLERAKELLSGEEREGIIAYKSVLVNETGMSVPLGFDETNKIKYHSVPRFPNLLVSGTTGTGKSNFLHSLILSLALNNTPDELQLVLFNPKMEEFGIYNGLKHLYNRHIYSGEDAEYFLFDLYDEIMDRSDIFEECGVSNIFEYNEWASMANAEKLPFIVVVMDECSGVKCGKNYLELFRVMKKSRSAGVHFILATQAPELLLCQHIKMFLNAKAVFRTSSVAQSWAVLDKSIGMDLQCGEMVLRPPSGKTSILKTPFVSSKTIESITQLLKEEYQ